MSERVEIVRGAVRLCTCGLLSMSLLLAAAAVARPALPNTTQVRGVVYLDADRDGHRDRSEAGVAGVKISNGRDIVITDADGGYRIPLADGDTLFLIKPAGFDLPRRANGLPDFWRHHFPSGSPRLGFGGIAATRVTRADFALLAGESAADGTLDVLVFGDPQPKRSEDVGYYERDIVAPLRADVAARLGLSLGDIVNDDLALYPAMNRITASLGIPWLHLPGNHDLDFDAPDDATSLLSYRAVFGPDTYAWEMPGVSFIPLDDVIYMPGASPSYVGGLRADQFHFLQAYLETLPDTQRIVLGAHIPLHDASPGSGSFRRADRERLFALLSRFPQVLLLTAHAHAQRHYFHTGADGWHGTAALHEYVVGAACGGFWTGLPDAAGIPDARMTDGTPNGYARLQLTRDDYRLRWHVARDSSDERIGVHLPRVLRHGSYPIWTVSANVYMGMEDTRVEYRIDGGEWLPMRRSLRADPRLVAINVADDAASELRAYDRAVEATASPHLWRGVLPTDLATGEHRVEVRAFDRWDGEIRAAPVSYRLDPFPPGA